MYMYMYIRTHVRTHACMHECVYVRTYVCVNVYAHTCARTCTCTMREQVLRSVDDDDAADPPEIDLPVAEHPKHGSLKAKVHWPVDEERQSLPMAKPETNPNADLFISMTRPRCVCMSTCIHARTRVHM